MTDPSRPKKKLETKTYVVLLRQNLAREGTPNVVVMAVRLTRAAADEVANQIAGAWVEKHVATK